MTPWWSRPIPATIGLVAPIILLAYCAPLPWRLYNGPDHRTAVGAMATAGVLGALLLGMGASRAYTRVTPRPLRTIAAVPTLDLLATIALTGTAIIFFPIALDPSRAQDYFTATSGFDSGGLRGDVTAVNGSRALAQSATLYAALWGFARWRTRQKLPTRHYVALILLFGATVLRSFVLSERLAALEFMFCIGLMWLASQPRPGAMRHLWNLAPAALPLFFAATEYFRSWRASYHRLYPQYGDFIADRLLTYYAAAANHGELLYQSGPTNPSYFYPYSGFLELASPLNINPRAFFSDPLPGLLISQGDPEFTNATGFFPYLYAFGVPLSLAGFFMLGLVAKASYEHFRNGVSSRLTLVYPLMLVGLLELPRLAYFSEPRFMAIALLISFAIIKTPAFNSQGDTSGAQVYS